MVILEILKFLLSGFWVFVGGCALIWCAMCGIICGACISLGAILAVLKPGK